MISLLKSQAKILNKIYATQAFNSIVGVFQNVHDIDYHKLYEIKCIDQQQQDNYKELVHNANQLCKYNKEHSSKLQPLILNLNKILANLPNNYTLDHIVIYSSISKCRIWPKMFKIQSQLVPQLIKFYKNIIHDFADELQFKFDPAILSTRYSKIMNKVQSRKKDHPALFNAIKQNNYNQIQNIIKDQGIDTVNSYVNGNYQKHCTHISVQQSSIDVNRLLWKLGLSFQQKDKQEQTPLFYAIKRCDLQIIKFLVQQVKVNINHKQYQDRTPIYLAAFQGNIGLVKYLFQRGGNPHVQSKLFRTPLSKACYLGNVQVVKFLIHIGVNLQSIDSKGRTALHNAAWGIQGGRQGKRRGSILLQDSPQCVKLLIQANHKIDFQDDDGFTPLFSAVSSKALRSMKILIENGANLKHKTKKQQNVSFIAAKYGHLEVLKILVEQHNCSYDQTDYQGFKPVMAAFTIQKRQCFSYLMDIHRQTKNFVDVDKLIFSLIHFGVEKNFFYLAQWIEIQQKNSIFFVQSLLQTNTDNIIKQIFNNQKMKMTQLLSDFIELLTKQNVSYYMLQKIKANKQNIKLLRELFTRCVIIYNQTFSTNSIIILFNFFIKYKQLILAKDIIISNLQINQYSQQKHVIQFLQLQTNLTDSVEAVRDTLQAILTFRMSNILLWLVKQLEQQQNKEYGVMKYPKRIIEEIIGIHEKQNFLKQQMSLLTYCNINGLYDMAGILQSKYKFPEDKKMKIFDAIYIPKYTYTKVIVNYQQQKINPTITPISNHVFNLKSLCDNMSEKQRIYLERIVKNQLNYKPNNKNYHIITCLKQLKSSLSKIKEFTLIGIDIEHYSTFQEAFICTIQVSTCEEVYVVDALQIENEFIKQFLEQLFMNDKFIKIMHSYDNDLKWVVEDFGITLFKNVVDTCKMFGVIEKYQNSVDNNNEILSTKLNSKSISLRNLSQIYLNFYMCKDFQRADWRIRPLFPQMLQYAAIDAEILIPLFICMLNKLKSYEKQVGGYFSKQKFVKSKGIKNKLQLAKFSIIN